MTDYIVKKQKGSASDVTINSDDVAISSQSPYTVDSIFDGSYGPTAKVGDLITKGPWIDVRAYGASGSDRTTIGSITAGQTTLTVTDSIDFAVGHGIRVVGAGAAGGDLVTKVTAISGGVFTLEDAAGTTVSGATVYHDDTEALQSAFDAVSSVCTTVVLPGGTYNVSSEVQTGTDDNLHIIGYGATISGDVSGTLLHVGDGTARIDGLHIEGITFNPSGSTTSALRIQYTSHEVIESCVFKGTATYGLLCEVNWVGQVKNNGFFGNYTHVIHTQDGPVTGYKNNGLTFESNWIKGANYDSCMAGLYIGDANARTRSIFNHYEGFSATGASAIYVDAGYKFVSYADVFEGCYYIGTQKTNHAVWQHLVVGSNNTNGVQVEGNACVVSVIKPAVTFTGNFVDVTGDNGTFYVPTSTQYSNTGSGNVFINTTISQFAFLEGDLRADGEGPKFYGFSSYSPTMSDADTTISYSHCGRVLLTSSLTAERTWTLPSADSSHKGWWVRITHTQSGFDLVIKPASGEAIGWLPADQVIRLKTAGTSIVLRILQTGRWYVESVSGQVVVPCASDMTLQYGAGQEQFVFTNQGATGTVTVTLPWANASGDRVFTFCRTEDYTFRVTPQGTNRFRGGSGAGKYKELDSTGDILKIRNVTSGYWEVEVDATTVNEP